jgi:hypothetical protein
MRIFNVASPPCPFAGEERWIDRSEDDRDADSLHSRRARRSPGPYAVYSLGGPGGTGPWQQDGTGIYYSGGAVGATGNGAFTHGNGIFLDGGRNDHAHVYAYNYDTMQPITLHLNWPGGRVAVGVVSPEGRLHVDSSNETAIIGRHTGNWVGVYGESQTSVGVWGNSISSIGVQGSSAGAYICGVYGYPRMYPIRAIFRNTAGGAALWADGSLRKTPDLGGATSSKGSRQATSDRARGGGRSTRSTSGESGHRAAPRPRVAGSSRAGG